MHTQSSAPKNKVKSYSTKVALKINRNESKCAEGFDYTVAQNKCINRMN